jgi:hypothetical protein
MKYVSLIFFVFFGSQLLAETYVNSEEIKGLLKKIEKASSGSSEVEDLTQKEINEIQKKVNLSNEKRTLETSDNSLGNNPENINLRVKSLEKYFYATSSLEEYIYSDSFSYQSFCKNNTNCKVIALVESEIFNQKMEKLNEKISTDKVEMAKSLKNVYPLEDKISMVKQIEQTTYSSTDAMGMSMGMSTSTIDENKKKKYIEISDGDVLGKVKVSITPTYIKLSKK